MRRWVNWSTSNDRKAYPVDPALIAVFDRSGRASIGHALETAVLIELERRRCGVTYGRTHAGYEVDFLARGPLGETDLIQVCADASDPATAEGGVAVARRGSTPLPGCAAAAADADPRWRACQCAGRHHRSAGV